jgi:hypothetical protein
VAILLALLRLAFFDRVSVRMDSTFLLLLAVAVAVFFIPWEKVTTFKGWGVELILDKPQVKGALEGTGLTWLTRWTVDFDACGTVPSPGELRWDIDGQPLSQTTCSFSHDFTELKSYVVSLTVTTLDGQSNSARASVTLRDLLIVSIGDSFASGEGNPDKMREDPGGVKWIDERCHRSAWAGPARAAIIIEKADPKTAVTFISFACTGASIKKGLLGAQDRKGHEVEPQLDKVFAAVGRRTIDALLLSIGGNDLEFSKLVEKRSY